MTKNDLIDTRGYLPEDRRFILATFLRGLYYGGSVFSNMPKPLFMKYYHTIGEKFLDEYAPYIRVACLKDDKDVILGYSVLNKDLTVLHWLFTKKSWRKIGIAKSLVPPTVTTVSHLTDTGLSITKQKGLIFNPFAI